MYLEIEYVLRGFACLRFIVTDTQHQEEVNIYIYIQIKSLEGDRESRGKGLWGLGKNQAEAIQGMCHGSQHSGNSGSQTERERGGKEKRSEEAAWLYTGP